MAIVNDVDVKTYLSITDKNDDNAIKLLIPMVEAQIKTYCNNQFTNGYPADIKLIAIQLIGFYLANNRFLASEDMGNGTVSFLTALPEHIKDSLKKHKVVKFI